MGLLVRKCIWLLALLLVVTSAAFSQDKLQTPEETNDRIRQLAKAMRVKQGEYLIGSGDVLDRKSTRLNSSHIQKSRMPSSA